jgi:hypothetical protein
LGDEASEQQTIRIHGVGVVDDQEDGSLRGPPPQRIGRRPKHREPLGVAGARKVVERIDDRRIDRGEDLGPRPVRGRPSGRPARGPDDVNVSLPAQRGDLTGEARR